MVMKVAVFRYPRALAQAAWKRPFNPIEPAFAKLKALLRMVAARTVDDLGVAIAEAIEFFPPADCGNFFATSEYEPN